MILPVTSIGKYAFHDCGVYSFTLPDNVTFIGENAFSKYNKYSGDYEVKRIYVNKGTKTLFALWSAGITPYDMNTYNELAPTSFEVVERTQTTVTIKINNIYSEYATTFDNSPLTDDKITWTGLKPEYSRNVTLSVSLDGVTTYNTWKNVSTSDISPTVNVITTTASSATLTYSYIEGDAVVTSQKLTFDGKDVETNSLHVTGLEPNRSYTAKYSITVAGYGEFGYSSSYTYTGQATIKTESLTLTTQQPKVVSLGNVIVSAESNIDDEEKNVGFEWRRTDWTDDFSSNTGTANMFEGTMEGYIRNLNTEKLWKFRPYYLADNGTYYYGDWVGLDPTNTSYFEPTVHTYAKIDVNGNTALIKGYALGGSDEVTVQGFKYWKNAGGGSSRVSETDIPSTAKTIEASGTVMEVSLSDLDYESSYNYVAFVTTSKGTYYGEIKTFETGNNPTGINDVKIDKAFTEDVHEIARYNMQGRRITTPEKGINIVKMSDGTTRKVFVK